MKRQCLALLTLLAALALSACGKEESGSGSIESDPGPVHVHGLGVNPSDDALYVATHTGLFRIAAGDTEAARVGDNFQDTMGFTVVGPDEFLGSGHPDLQQDLPPFLGLIESDDAGENWNPVSLEGDADFHVLEAIEERIYGFGSDFNSGREQFLVSDDGGDTWEPLELPESLLSLAINPSNPDELVASGQERLHHSTDGGQNWEPITGEPGLLSWPEPDRLYLVNAEGQTAASDGAKSEWVSRGEVGGQPAAFEATGPEELFVALHDGEIRESMDGGETWSLRSSP